MTDDTILVEVVERGFIPDVISLVWSEESQSYIPAPREDEA